MTYTIAHHRAETKERFDALVAGGSGFHAYALYEAEKLVKEDPILHGGLVANVEQQIGPEATKAARRALEWFNGTRGRVQPKEKA